MDIFSKIVLIIIIMLLIASSVFASGISAYYNTQNLPGNMPQPPPEEENMPVPYTNQLPYAQYPSYSIPSQRMYQFRTKEPTKYTEPTQGNYMPAGSQQFIPPYATNTYEPPENQMQAPPSFIPSQQQYQMPSMQGNQQMTSMQGNQQTQTPPPQSIQPMQSIGSNCNQDTDCIGYSSNPLQAGAACCNGICQQKSLVPGVVPTWSCPYSPPATTQPTQSTQSIGASCNQGSDCAGYTPAPIQPGTACCNGICQQKSLVPGVVPTWSCPSPSPVITQPTQSTQSIGASCKQDTDCIGYSSNPYQPGTACCGGICQPKSLVPGVVPTWSCPFSPTTTQTPPIRPTPQHVARPSATS
jgi:hypothetical protein